MTVEIAFLVFFTAVIYGKYLNERAMKSLSIEEKAKLIDGFSGLRVYSLVPVVLLMATYWLALRYASIPYFIVSILYFVLLIAFVVVVQFYVSKKLRALSMPQAYIKGYGYSRLVQNLGSAVLIFSAFVPAT